MTATLLLGTELVLTCHDCGAVSTDDLFGTEGWALRRVSAQRLVDVCPCCAPRARERLAPKGRA